jgi:hypothetical protein
MVEGRLEQYSVSIGKQSIQTFPVVYWPMPSEIAQDIAQGFARMLMDFLESF